MSKQYGFVDGMIVGRIKAAEARRNGLAGRVFDWHKAAQILKERQPRTADAGLATDLPSTAGEIWRDGQPYMDGYTYLASAWATPVLIIDDEEIPCFVAEGTNNWDHGTKWPASALELLK